MFLCFLSIFRAERLIFYTFLQFTFKNPLAVEFLIVYRELGRKE